jgi:hypothetical protein
MAVEFLAQQADIRVRDFWPLVRKRVAERKDAEYHAIFARDAAEKLLVEQNKKWLEEFGDKLFENIIVILETGGVIQSEKFVCSVCKTKLLFGWRYLQKRYKSRQFSLASKNELEQVIRKDLLDGHTMTYVNCDECRNTSPNFRLTPSMTK